MSTRRAFNEVDSSVDNKNSMQKTAVPVNSAKLGRLSDRVSGLKETT